MEMEEAFKVGCLFVPPQTFLRKSWCKKFCSLYNASNHGIQRLELFDSEVKQSPSKIMPLTDCIKVTVAPQKHQPNVFEVRTKNASYLFSVDNFQEMSDWLAAFQTVAFGSQGTVPVQNNSVQVVKEAKQEENLLYSSMDEPEVYSVTTLSTGAVLRNGLNGNYNLIVTSVNLSIAEECPQGRLGRIILTWPYRHIRRYGCSNSNFSFEAGRKCASGEGLFTFSTNEGTQIFQSVDAHVSALKSSQSELDIPASPCLSDDKDSFFTSKDSQSLFKEYAQFEKPSAVPDFSFNAASKCQTDIHTMNSMNKTPLPKALLPLQKPPRKSKSKTDADKVSNYVSLTSESINRNSGFASNFYEELHARDAYNNQRRNSDHCFTAVESFKTLEKKKTSSVSTLNSAFVDVEKKQSNTVNVSTLTDELKHIISCNTEKFQIPDLKDKLNIQTTTNTLSDSHYDRLVMKRPHPVLRPVISSGADHIYGKLLTKQPASPKQDLSSAYDSLQFKKTSVISDDASPRYANVQLSNQLPSNVSTVTGDSERDPDHFLKNDAEYAEVFKKNENLAEI